eukprot:117889_1
MHIFVVVASTLLVGYVSSVQFTPECHTHLIDQHYGYNISCEFNITATTNTIYHVSLNWSIPSQSSFIFDNQTYFIGGENPTNVYQKSSLIAKWNSINASTTAILRLYMQPNMSITRNEAFISTVTIQYYNISNISLTVLSSITKSIMIEFTKPSNDGPNLYASSYSLTTMEDTPINANVYVHDSDFYELSVDGLMRANITVINGTIALSSNFGGLYFLKGNDTDSSDIQMVGSINSINQSLNIITFTPRKNMVGNAQIIISVTDQGNTGTGQQQSASIIITITITQIYEIPHLITPIGTIQIDEDSTFNFEQINCSVTTDVDPEYVWLQLTISAIYGNFSFDGGTGTMNVNFGTHSITINDTAELLSSYFKNITYHTIENFNEESNDLEIIYLSLLDHKNLTQTKQFNIEIESVNDAPIIDINITSLQTYEDTPKQFTIAFDDIDFDIIYNAKFTVTLKVFHGTLSLNHRKGLYFLIDTSWE